MGNNRKKFGNKIRHYRTEQGLTQWKLADKADLHYTYVGAIERGEKNITLENIHKIANALNIKISDLFDPEEIKSEKMTPEQILKQKLLKIVQDKSEEEIKRILKILNEILKFKNVT